MEKISLSIKAVDRAIASAQQHFDAVPRTDSTFKFLRNLTNIKSGKLRRLFKTIKQRGLNIHRTKNMTDFVHE